MNLFIIFDSLLKNCGSSSGVEHQLPKLRVEGSNPFSRSNYKEVNSFLLYKCLLLAGWNYQTFSEEGKCNKKT